MLNFVLSNSATRVKKKKVAKPTVLVLPEGTVSDKHEEAEQQKKEQQEVPLTQVKNEAPGDIREIPTDKHPVEPVQLPEDLSARIKLKNAAQATSTPSIKNALSTLSKPVEAGKADNEPTEGNDQPISAGEEHNKPIVEEDVKLVWNAFLVKIKDSEPRIARALTKSKFQIEGNGVTITVSFQNNALADDFKLSNKPALINHLRTGLQNSNVVINEQIITNEDEPQVKFYTDQDKLKHMMEKNPALQKLRQDLNLDFD